MPHIKNLIDTDCYIEFDNATELSRFAHRNEIYLSRMVFSDDKYIRFYSDGEQARPFFNNYDDEYEAPVHKYENVTEWVKPYRERDEDDMYQDYIDSNL